MKYEKFKNNFFIYSLVVALLANFITNNFNFIFNQNEKFIRLLGKLFLTSFRYEPNTELLNTIFLFITMIYFNEIFLNQINLIKFKKILINLFLLLLLFVFVFNCIGYSIRELIVRPNTIEQIEILNPYIYDSKYKKLKSEYYSMSNEKDYIKLVKEINRLEKIHKIN